ncbi:NADP-dependent phosphogluconate dehydrogenase [Aquimarina gracilis]|uniref:6-phosphogluconate dehydrogenase, decarboxylating n=1 Tax=Aquimarina gracilis TaxID=874422 RepID=A0ABU5ZXJ2_9FLAO|nr:NADP-dependent phosphogluconate dehydrogenase [Aquimarina gracilis]MEB3346587.1 NADP-dependent phosphogluconate dehydrogenase [Aquimarina gracilis]
MGKRIIYIVYGVSGCGKTTVGKELSKKLAIPFYDADDFHSQQNKQKMATGMPLDDNDRKPWLLRLAQEIGKWHISTGAVLACSALKNSYRDLLESIDSKYIQWIYLQGSYDLIAQRLQKRQDHFFDATLLTSQFETLEKPFRGIIVNIEDIVENIIDNIMMILDGTKQEIGLIGLGIMGKSLAKNLISKNFRVSVYNRQVKGKEVDVAQNFVNDHPNDNVLGFDDIPLFVYSLAKPRVIILMVNAGKAVDAVIDELLPYLNPEDCLIDGGNSHFKDTDRRISKLDKLGINFLGTGISGGEQGALKGPSMMPGGSKSGYELAGTYLESIAAKDKFGNSCCSFLGLGSSGHFVKMVHNGIEYAEMQLIAEIYHLLRFYVGKSPKEIATIFDSWCKQGKKSYLLEITAKILRTKEGNEYLIDKILDKAGQKGTGSWTITAALEEGVAISNIFDAVAARSLSSQKMQRIEAAKAYSLQDSNVPPLNINLDYLEKSFEIANISNHHIGFDLIQKTSKSNNWQLNLSEIARIWTNGCIIRSELMEELSLLFGKENDTEILMFPEIIDKVKPGISALANIVALGLLAQCSLPVLSSTINYVLTYTSKNTSANMIQAQRDFFGAHTYQRIDRPWDQYFHTNWKE